MICFALIVMPRRQTDVVDYYNNIMMFSLMLFLCWECEVFLLSLDRVVE